MTTLPQTDSIRHVLVVEDEPLVRLCAAEEIGDAGYATLEAADADAAMRILEQRDDIDYIFTDVDMPGSMDGLALARAARDRWPPIGIIVTSGKRFLTREQLPRGSRFLAKPYLTSTVVDLLAALAPCRTA